MTNGEHMMPFRECKPYCRKLQATMTVVGYWWKSWGGGVCGCCKNFWNLSNRYYDATVYSLPPLNFDDSEIENTGSSKVSDDSEIENTGSSKVTDDSSEDDKPATEKCKASDHTAIDLTEDNNKCIIGLDRHAYHCPSETGCQIEWSSESGVSTSVNVSGEVAAE
jgi:hypothetical protein